MLCAVKWSCVSLFKISITPMLHSDLLFSRILLFIFTPSMLDSQSNSLLPDRFQTTLLINYLWRYMTEGVPSFTCEASYFRIIAIKVAESTEYCCLKWIFIWWTVGLQPITAVIERDVEYPQARSPERANTWRQTTIRTHSQLTKHAHLWSVGGSQNTWREPTETRGEHARIQTQDPSCCDVIPWIRGGK